LKGNEGGPQSSLQRKNNFLELESEIKLASHGKLIRRRKVASVSKRDEEQRVRKILNVGKRRGEKARKCRRD